MGWRRSVKRLRETVLHKTVGEESNKRHGVQVECGKHVVLYRTGSSRCQSLVSRLRSHGLSIELSLGIVKAVAELVWYFYISAVRGV